MVNLNPDALVNTGLIGDDLAHTSWTQDTEFYDPEIASVLRCMVREVAAGSPNGALYSQSLSLGLLLRLAGSHSLESVQRERGALSAAQRKRLDELIQHGLATDLSLNALAGATGFSASQFTRLFRNTFGQTPHQYVLSKRLSKAKELIQVGDLPLAVIAQSCGFAGQSHMTSVFTRTLGVSPGSIKRLQQGG